MPRALTTFRPLPSEPSRADWFAEGVVRVREARKLARVKLGRLYDAMASGELVYHVRKDARGKERRWIAVKSLNHWLAEG